jgi:alpha-tubulin suppressor-like RCC1 family protein
MSMSLAITNDNKLYSAGYNGRGQLGDFKGTNLLSFTYIPQGDGLVEVLNNPDGASQENTQFSLRNDGRIMMAGSDFYRQMGQGWQGGSVEELTPMPLILDSGDSVKSVVTDHTYRFAYITQNGKFYVSGSNNNNQLGVNNGEHVVEYTTEITSIPSGVKKANFLATDASLVIDKNGDVWVAGKNSNNQLGDPDTTLKYLTWTKIPSITNAKEIYKYFGFSTAILTDSGEVWVAGKNTNGQFGLGHTNNVETWTKIPAVTGVQDIIIHEDKSIYLMMSDQTVLAAGYNANNQFGTSTTSKQTTFIPLINNEFLEKLKGDNSGDSCS